MNGNLSAENISISNISNIHKILFAHLCVWFAGLIYLNKDSSCTVKYSKAPEMRRDRLNNVDVSVDKVKADNYACLIIVHLVYLVTKGRLLDLHKSVP